MPHVQAPGHQAIRHAIADQNQTETEGQNLPGEEGWKDLYHDAFEHTGARAR